MCPSVGDFAKAMEEKQQQGEKKFIHCLKEIKTSDFENENTPLVPDTNRKVIIFKEVPEQDIYTHDTLRLIYTPRD